MIIRTCTKIREMASLKFILNSFFSKQKFLCDLKQLAKANLKPDLTFSKPDLNSAVHNTDPNLSILLDSSSVNNKSLADLSKANAVMRRLDGVI